MSEKTEKPTPRRLRKAREQGDSPVSGALVQAAGFAVALAVAPAAVRATMQRATAMLHAGLAPSERLIDPWALTETVLSLTIPLLAAAGVAAAAVGFVQTGGMVAMGKLAPDLARANPFTGLRNVVNKQRMVSVLRALGAALLVGWLAVDLVFDHGADLAHSVANPGGAATLAGDLVIRLAWLAAAVGGGLAVLDVLVTRHAWEKRHRMSKDEIKREHREAEGDPELVAARKRAHQEVLAGATVAAVRNATVVVVNPTHLAVALAYSEDDDDAPRVVAQGAGDLARRMIDAARAYDVPVVRDVPVARALSELEIGDEIPEALYEAVAEILREVWSETEGTQA